MQFPMGLAAVQHFVIYSSPSQSWLWPWDCTVKFSQLCYFLQKHRPRALSPSQVAQGSSWEMQGSAPAHGQVGAAVQGSAHLLFFTIRSKSWNIVLKWQKLLASFKAWNSFTEEV